MEEEKDLAISTLYKAMGVLVDKYSLDCLYSIRDKGDHLLLIVSQDIHIYPSESRGLPVKMKVAGE